MAKKKENYEDRPELTKYLANYLLTVREGEKVLNVRDLAKATGASTGSISRVINQLEDSQSISIGRRGKLGSFLERKSLGDLWNIIEEGPMVISLTMPSFPKIDGLATALYCLLNEAGIETYLIFIRGSYNRLKALRNGHCHAAIMSVMAAEQLCGRNEEIILRLPPKSFLTDHQVFFKKTHQRPSEKLRVGIESDSFDLKFLTEREFDGIAVEYQKVTLMQIGRVLQEGQVDAAIWNTDHMKPYLDGSIDSRPLSPHVRETIGDRDTCAAAIIRSNNTATKIVLNKVLQPSQIIRIQSEVISGKMVPRY